MISNPIEVIKSNVLLFRIFDFVEIELIFRIYKSPALSIELLPIKYKLSGCAILKSIFVELITDIQWIIVCAVVSFAQKIISSIE